MRTIRSCTTSVGRPDVGAATRRLTLLGGTLLGGNLGVLMVAYWLGGPAGVVRQVAIICRL